MPNDASDANDGSNVSDASDASNENDESPYDCRVKSRRDFFHSSISAAGAFGILSLLACQPHQHQEEAALTPLLTSRTLVQIGVDAVAQDYAVALAHHRRLAYAQLAKSPTDRNTIFSPFGLYTLTALLAEGTTNQQYYWHKLGLPTRARDRMRVIAALIGESLQWSAPEGTVAIEPDIMPRIDHHCGIFMPDDQQPAPQYQAMMRRYFDHELYPMRYSDPSCAELISRWLTYNTAVDVDAIVMPSLASWMCLDAWIFSAKWQEPFRYYGTHNFYSTKTRVFETRFYHTVGNYQVDATGSTARIVLPFDQQITMHIYVPVCAIAFNSEDGYLQDNRVPHCSFTDTVFPKVTVLNFATAGLRPCQLIMPMWVSPIDESVDPKNYVCQNYGQVLQCSTSLAGFSSASYLTSIASVCELHVSPGGVGPQVYITQEMFNNRADTHYLSQSAVIDLNIPFYYQIVDATTGLVFLQGNVCYPV